MTIDAICSINFSSSPGQTQSACGVLEGQSVNRQKLAARGVF